MPKPSGRSSSITVEEYINQRYEEEEQELMTQGDQEIKAFLHRMKVARDKLEASYSQ